MRNPKEKRGITLIALIITIVGIGDRHHFPFSGFLEKGTGTFSETV